MSRIIHARLDPETEKLLRDCQRRWGWTDSQAVREGIKMLGGLLGHGRARAMVGVGKFQSGIPDLGSNKNHLKGFGR
jgi:hypothetical protein